MMDNESITIYFFQDATDYLIRYAISSSYIFTTDTMNSFLIGHTYELYLKAVRMKQCNNYDKVLSYKHKLIKLLSDNVKHDSSFLSDISAISNKDVQELLKSPGKIKNRDIKSITRDKYGEFTELFKIAQLFENYKYAGLPTPADKSKRPVGYAGSVPNNDHILIIKSIWKYFGYPKGSNQIKQFIDNHTNRPKKWMNVEIPYRAIDYLSELSKL